MAAASFAALGTRDDRDERGCHDDTSRNAIEVVQAATARAAASARWLAALPLATALVSLQSIAAQAGPCLPTSQPLLKIPEIVVKGRRVDAERWS